MDSSIPVIDLSAVSNAAAALREGFGHYGLVYIKNHGLDAALLDGFYDEYLAFTRRPLPEKQALGRPDLCYQRGWTPPNTETAVLASGQPDFKECYFAAPEPAAPRSKLLFPQLYCDNVWPTGSARFQEVYLELGRKLHAVGEELLRGTALSLGLPADTLTERIAGGPHVTRALRYLPLTAEQVGTGILWGEEHTDFNLLTLLPGGRFLDPQGARAPRPDDESGLYLRTRPTRAEPKGRLVQGTPPAGCLVAQVGQQLEILTGGELLATPHVITAPKVPGYSRLSSAHFVHMNAEQLLSPLPKFQTDDVLRKYSPPVLAGTYDLKTLVDIGLAPPAALQSFGYRNYDRLSALRG